MPIYFKWYLEHSIGIDKMGNSKDHKQIRYNNVFWKQSVHYSTFNMELPIEWANGLPYVKIPK